MCLAHASAVCEQGLAWRTVPCLKVVIHRWSSPVVVAFCLLPGPFRLTEDPFESGKASRGPCVEQSRHALHRQESPGGLIAALFKAGLPGKAGIHQNPRSGKCTSPQDFSHERFNPEQNEPSSPPQQPDPSRCSHCSSSRHP
jgi:hypothetical protein